MISLGSPVTYAVSQETLYDGGVRIAEENERGVVPNTFEIVLM